MPERSSRVAGSRVAHQVVSTAHLPSAVRSVVVSKSLLHLFVFADDVPHDVATALVGIELLRELLAQEIGRYSAYGDVIVLQISVACRARLRVQPVIFVLRRDIGRQFDTAPHLCTSLVTGVIQSNLESVHGNRANYLAVPDIGCCDEICSIELRSRYLAHFLHHQSVLRSIWILGSRSGCVVLLSRPSPSKYGRLDVAK